MLEHEVLITRYFICILYHLFYIFIKNAPGVVESLKIVTRANSERLARYAFDLAQKSGRKKVTTVHKANIMYSTQLSIPFKY
jgi:isocitrate/isopropylmalate dehydrogenase